MSTMTVPRLAGAEVDRLDPYAFMAVIGKRVIHPGGRRSTEELLQRADLRPDHHVLDVGCGVGTTSIQISRRFGACVTAVDISPYMLARARASARAAGVEDQVAVENGDVTRLQFPDATFDRVIAEAVTMFVDRPRAARELVRVCKPGGRVLSTEFLWRKPPTPEARHVFMIEVCPGMAMPFYTDHIYPHVVSMLANPEPIRQVRQRIIPLAQGTVLEVGAGSGVNFSHYDPARVNKLYALEPNPGMIRLAERQRRRTKLDIEFLDLPGERIPLGDDTVDTVVSTFTLCTIPGVVEAIRGIERVLRPDGKLVFFELGLSPDPHVRRWQEWWDPIHHRVFSGLRLTRDIPSLIVLGGFQIEQMEAAYLAPFLKAWTHCWWGIAVSQPR